MKSNRIWYQDGLRDGVPIALGYFAVAFTLGIAARNAGFSAFQAAVSSLLNHASAGEYAVISLVAAGAGYWEMAVMALVSNARYLLMGCSLSTRPASYAPLVPRALGGSGIADESFGVSAAVPGRVNPFYTYGAMSVSIPSWALGTFLGVVLGNVLPPRLVSALSVGLYGMFLAIIVPPRPAQPGGAGPGAAELRRQLHRRGPAGPGRRVLRGADHRPHRSHLPGGGPALPGGGGPGARHKRGGLPMNIWLYILISALVAFLIRATPLVLIRREIRSRTLRSFLYYVPYVTLAVMTFPAIVEATESPLAGLLALVAGAALAWFGGSLFQVAVACCLVVFLAELFLV